MVDMETKPKWQQLKESGRAFFVRVPDQFDRAHGQKAEVRSLPVIRASAKQVTLGGYGPGSCTVFFVHQVEGASNIGEPSCSDLYGRPCLYATERDALVGFELENRKRIEKLKLELAQAEADADWTSSALAHAE